MMEDESSQNEDGKQLALKNLLFCDGEEPKVQHDDDSRAKLAENDGNTDSTSDNAKAHGSSPSRCSPDPNCAICLGTLENKSFTDSCFHTFCFTCLVEWSKVKAECPLCKQPFKSIVHNVRSIEDYDQYYISSRNTDTSSWRGTDGRCFRYRTTLSTDRWSGRHRYGTFEDSIEYRTHRMIYAPHSVTFPPVRNYIPEYPSTSSFRRHIYDSGLWVKPLGDGNAQRYRITSPEFYRQNPACTHRLTPWLNRELLALLYDSESQVTFVLELILALIMRYDIRSEEFYVHIEPYLQHRTSHFIHEFFNFAASLHDMRSYDNCAVYEKLESISENSTNVVSSPGSDVVPLTEPSITISENSPSVIQTAGSSNLSKRKSKKSSKKQPKLFLRRNQQSNIWQSVLPTSSRSLNSTSSGDSSDYAISSSIQGFLDLGVVSGPSTSGLQITSTQLKTTTRKGYSHVNDTSGSSTDTDDECIILDVVKPRSLRTPEVINLVSSSEDERTIDSNDAGDCCVTTEIGKAVAQQSKRKGSEEEEIVGEKASKRKARHHRKRSATSSALNDFSNCENLFSQAQRPASPVSHDQCISSPLPASVCRTYTESDESKSQEHHLGQDSLDSQLSVSDKHISVSSCSTECSQNACESERTNSTNKNFSKVSFSREDVPSSISSPSSVIQTPSKKTDPVFSVVAIKQGAEITFNCKTLSLTQNEENRSCEKWQHNSSSSSSVEESTTFEVSENKGKLRSVICRFSANDKQNSRSDSSHYTSSHCKKHKHKKKKKKHKHKHHKHSHSVSD